MRVVLVVFVALVTAVAGCTKAPPSTQSIGDGSATCTGTAGPSNASAACASASSSTSASSSKSGTTSPAPAPQANPTGPKGNATGNGTGNVTGNATGNATGNQTAAPTTPQAYTGSTTVSVAACPESTLGIIGIHPYEDYPGGPLEGIEWLAFDIDPATIGQTYTWSNGQTVPLIWGVGFAFYDASDSLILFEAAGAGTVPDGAAIGVFYPCGPGPIDVSYASP